MLGLHLRNLTRLFLAMSAAFLAISLTIPGMAVADDTAKPAKKDSPAGVKSKQALLTTSVEPAQATPGDSVTFKVTAKVNPGFHIYKYSAVKGPGPVTTSFDFFDRGGLELEGSWKASREPEKHKDPNFPEVDSVEYYEGEVTWSIKLKLPASTVAGKKTLHSGAVHGLRRQDV